MIECFKNSTLCAAYCADCYIRRAQAHASLQSVRLLWCIYYLIRLVEIGFLRLYLLSRRLHARASAHTRNSIDVKEVLGRKLAVYFEARNLYYTKTMFAFCCSPWRRSITIFNCIKFVAFLLRIKFRLKWTIKIAWNFEKRYCVLRKQTKRTDVERASIAMQFIQINRSLKYASTKGYIDCKWMCKRFPESCHFPFISLCVHCSEWDSMFVVHPADSRHS